MGPSQSSLKKKSKIKFCRAHFFLLKNFKDNYLFWKSINLFKCFINNFINCMLICQCFEVILKFVENMHVHVLNVFKNHWFIVGQLTSVILYWSTHKLYCHLREILQYCTGYHRMKFITFFITVTVQLRKSPKQHKMMRRPRNYGKFQKRWLDSKNEWTVNKDHNEWTKTINI